MPGGAYASPRGPEAYRVTADTTAGHFEVQAHRAWAPHAADRFHDLACRGYYDDSRFFRVVPDRWVQFGIAGDPAVAAAWRGRTIPDDVLVQPNQVGFVAFANTGPGTRATQVFINLGDNSAQIDREPAFAPFGQVIHGMGVVAALYSGYGEASGSGMRAGRQDEIFRRGNAHLDAGYPRLDQLRRLVVTSGCGA